MSIVIDWQETLLKTDLPANAKYLGMYLRTFMNAKSDIAWPSLKRIEHETGLGHATVLKYLGVLEEAGWITRERGRKGVNTRYHAQLPPEIVEEGRSRADLSRSRADLGVGREPTTNNQYNNQRITNNGANATRFRPPTTDEVAEYCREKGYSVDPERFVNFYESKGWMVGKTKMRKWKAAVANWEKGNGESRQRTDQPQDTRRLSPYERVRARAEQRARERSGSLVATMGSDGDDLG